MSTGDIRCTQLTTIFNYLTLIMATSHLQKTWKRKMTLIADNFNEDQNLPIPPTFAERHREQQKQWNLIVWRIKMHDINLIVNFYRNASDQNWYLKIWNWIRASSWQPQARIFRYVLFQPAGIFSYIKERNRKVLWQNNKWNHKTH